MPAADNAVIDRLAVEHAVIAAAGLGSRLGHGRPKCLVEIHGRPILAHQLELLRDVADVRIVVGFCEDDVLAATGVLDRGVVVVRNPAYRSTTTLHSYAMGARHLDEPCLYLDGDILFERSSFEGFLVAARPQSPLLAYTDAKTDDAVYVDVRDGMIHGFSREIATPYEWANLAWLPPRWCEDGDGAVYEHLTRHLPIPGRHIVSFEVDNEADLQRAWDNFPAQTPQRRAGDIR